MQSDSSVKFMTSWLPAKYAKAGTFVKLRDDRQSEWVDGWEVQHVGSIEIDESDVVKQSQRHREHRLATDI